MTKITNEDNMKLMSRYPDGYFDLAIVDPPYNKNADKGTNGFGNSKNRKYKGGWDNETPKPQYWNELFRVSKNQIVWGFNYFVEYLQSSNCIIVWDKVGTIKFKNPFAEVELAWTSFKSVSKKVTIIQQGFLNSNDTVIHPTQKPVKLYKWLLHNYAKPGDKILDTHLGSGSIAIACHDLGFDLTACELDKDYYQAAMKRLKLHQAQLTLDLR